MSGCIDDKKTWDFVLLQAILVDNGRFRLDCIDREIRGTNLLSDTTSFAFLNIGLADLKNR